MVAKMTKSGQLRTIRKGTENVDKKGVNGVYGAHPSPALREYPQDMGKDTIPIKFAESGINTLRQRNNMRNVGQARQQPQNLMGGSKIKTDKNKYRSDRKGK